MEPSTAPIFGKFANASRFLCDVKDPSSFKVKGGGPERLQQQPAPAIASGSTAALAIDYVDGMRELAERT